MDKSFILHVEKMNNLKNSKKIEVEQLNNMPLIKGLKAYIGEQNIVYHMPGHKQGKGFPQYLQDLLIKMDVTEVEGTDNLAHPQGIIAQAEQMAAKAFGADHTFFLTQGSTIGNHAMILATCQRGDKLMVPRNSHVSVINAMMLYGIEPVWIQPEYNAQIERLATISVDKIQATLKKQPTVKGALLTSPTYYGEIAPLREIAALLHEQGKVLLVDQAHGAHFPFSDYLPEDAGRCGADIWVQSAHKTLPALTQGAYLHIASNQLKESVNQAIRFLHTSSPSYMVMASLDYARAFMEAQGGNRFEHLYETITRWRERMHKETNIGVEAFGKKRDFSRIVLDVKAVGWTGAQWQEYLRKEGIQCEMADLRYCVLIATVFDGCNWLDKIIDVSKEIPRRKNKQQEETIHVIQETMRQMPIKAMTLSHTFEKKKEVMRLKQAEGRVCKRAIGFYPPGIPLVCPGEIISKEIIELIETAKKVGIDVFGLDDGTVIVVKDRVKS